MESIPPNKKWQFHDDFVPIRADVSASQRVLDGSAWAAWQGRHG